MTKADRERANRPCTFCGDPGVTGEHLFSQWMHKKKTVVLPITPNEDQLRHNWRGGGTDPRSGEALASGRPIESGPLRNRKYYVVCDKRCNAGWMAGLEEEVKPSLSRLILGESVVLATEERVALARWAVMKAIVLAATNPSDLMIFTPDERRALMDSGDIPATTRVFLLPNPTQTATHAEYFSKHFMAPFPSKPGEAYPAHLFQVTMLFGSVAIGVIASLPHVPPPEVAGGAPEWFEERRLWPAPSDNDDSMPWPRGGQITPYQLEVFAAAGREMVNWLDGTGQSMTVGMYASVERLRATGGKVEIEGGPPQYFF